MRALLLVLLVGCSADGVIVEVDTNGLGVASVELVLSDRICQDPLRGGNCMSIQGPTFQSALGKEGDIYARDASATISELDEGIARFELPEDTNRIRMAFAIGRDAQGQIVGAAVMARTIDLAAGPVVYRVALDRTTELRDRPQPDTEAAAVQWGDQKQCLGIHPLRSTMPTQRPVFILPDGDPDCDGRRSADEGECDALWFDGVFFDEGSAAHCAQQSMTIPGAPCVIGHIPQCIEADVSEPGCVEEPFRCVPDVLCNACATDDTQCQNGHLASAAIDTRIDCEIPATIAVDDDLGTSCAENVFFIDASSIPMLDGNATCESADFVTTPNMAIDAQLDTKAELGDAKMEIILVTPACEIKFKWNGTIPKATVSTLHSVLVIHLDVGGQSREIWMPVNFLASSGCAAPSGVTSCAFAGNPGGDAIASCLR